MFKDSKILDSTTTVMWEMQKTTDRNKLARLTGAFLKMKKFDIAELLRACDAA